MKENWLKVTAKSDKVAKIKIHGTIGGGFWEEGITDAEVEADLEEVSRIKADTIQVDLDSLGGSVKHGMKIYNLLKAHPANVEVNITGWTASMGTVIAMAAAKGKLKMVNNGQFLVHEARTVSMGTKSQIESDAKLLENINNDIANIYAERTGLSKDDALALMALNGGEGEFWGADETIEKGFVDSSYKPAEAMAAAKVSIEDLKAYHIKAKTKNNNKMNFNVKTISAFIKDIASKAVNGLKDEDKTVENIESLVNTATEEVVGSLQGQVDAVIKEKDEAFAELQAKYDSLSANGSEPSGDDANLDLNPAPLSEADKAVKEFVGQLSDADKLVMTTVEEK